MFHPFSLASREMNAIYLMVVAGGILILSIILFLVRRGPSKIPPALPRFMLVLAIAAVAMSLYMLFKGAHATRPGMPGTLSISGASGGVPGNLPRTKTLDLGKGVKMDLVLIPAGEFVMGSPESEPERDGSEGPQHKVTIKKPFYMSKTEVTQAQWDAIMNGNQSKFQGDLNLPEEQISWGDCHKFCHYLSEKTGVKARLPSEAEWEYACRAGTTTPFAFGKSLSSTQANFNGENPYGDAPKGPNLKKTAPVASYKPNAWGLYDMHGNVNQWVEDVWHDTYANGTNAAPADGSAWMSGGDQEHHVYRGGSWMNDGSVLRSAIRFAESEKERRSQDTGCRIVVDAG